MFRLGFKVKVKVELELTCFGRSLNFLVLFGFDTFERSRLVGGVVDRSGKNLQNIYREETCIHSFVVKRSY